MDIKILFNFEMGNYEVVMNPTVQNDPNVSSMTIRNSPRVIPPNLNKSMNFIIWNCNGGNGPDFRRNFSSLLDCHKSPLVVLLETKMQNNQVLLDDFPLNKMIEVLAVDNFGGIIIPWDDSLLELDEIAITEQEIHAIIKVSANNVFFLFICINASCLRKILWDNLHTIKDTNSRMVISRDLTRF